ncbi:MAG: L-glutamate gamma-semialdehyde dehydrogenase [Firmicutes bacterium]|nr:L-glutamate gamma-semialdehyde dehydrogenase [Bacillota bacterium]
MTTPNNHHPKFSNLAVLDFTIPENKKGMEDAIAKVKAESEKEYPIVIGSENVITDEKLKSWNPSHKNQTLGVFQKGNIDIAEKAMQKALETFETWKNVPAAQRADYLFKAAEIMKNRRFEMDAVMILEIGKNWIEADADLCEAVDFLEFYARQMLEYAGGRSLTEFEGEDNTAFYIPLGVGLVIPPWNFPCAILTGMTASAIVAGNTVILKPASDTPLIAAKVVEIFQEAGLPEGVLTFLTGPGGSIGDYLVEHPKTRFISFTGSMEVGKGIYEKAGKVFPGQIWLKRTVIEMGGKDAIVVDSEADVESAAQGIVASAFGFQGQKCSACSRAIVDEKVYDEIVEKVIALTEKLTVGDPCDPANFMGPVSSKSSYAKVMEYIEIGKQEGVLVAGGTGDDSEGYFIRPTVFKDIKPGSRLEQEEIFGPVLAIIKSKDYDDGLRIANDTIYGLTGAVYTKNEDKIKRAYKEFHVGNLYINRKCTGALVDVHPFGGFNMSGTDSKAGGRDYLLLFMQMKSVSRKIIK